MPYIGSDSKTSRAWHRQVPGLLLVIMLNLALQPCAGALEQDHDCPHCPPADNGAMSMHEGHDAAMHDGHDVAKGAMPCASPQGSCDGIGGASIDGRNVQLKIKPAAELPVAISHTPEMPTVRYTNRRSGSSLDPPLHAGVAPPVHVLFCVYLK